MVITDSNSIVRVYNYLCTNYLLYITNLNNMVISVPNYLLGPKITFVLILSSLPYTSHLSTTSYLHHPCSCVPSSCGGCVRVMYEMCQVSGWQGRELAWCVGDGWGGWHETEGWSDEARYI